MFEHLSDQEVLSLLEPIMGHMMDGSSERNHAKHTRDCVISRIGCYAWSRLKS